MPFINRKCEVVLNTSWMESNNGVWIGAEVVFVVFLYADGDWCQHFPCADRDLTESRVPHQEGSSVGHNQCHQWGNTRTNQVYHTPLININTIIFISALNSHNTDKLYTHTQRKREGERERITVSCSVFSSLASFLCKLYKLQIENKLS